MAVLRILLGVAGLVLIAIVIWDAFETILVPRRIGRRVRLTRYFYVLTWRLWRALALALGRRKAGHRETLLGFYGPLSLILLLGLWACGLIVAFALIETALQPAGLPFARFGSLLYMSGETFFTLGFGDITPSTGLGRGLAVIEAGLGFGFLGTVVGYLPTMYGAFAQREAEISLMDARAGSPPTAAELLRRSAHAGDPWREEVLRAWERWCAQLLEAHISYPQLAYYRSQHSNQSWLGALTMILDSTALLVAREPGGAGGKRADHQAQLTFAMARHAMVDITQIFVHELPAALPPRWTREAMLSLRQALADTAASPPAGEEYEARLGVLRRMYEPYAQALAAHLLFELPPWAHAVPRRDNWQGGPWDKQLLSSPASQRAEDHF